MSNKNSGAEKPVAIITGASSGFGYEAARALCADGWQVFGSSRQARESDIENCVMLKLDVRDDESVRVFVEEVTKLSGGRIDMLVNNAGYVLNGFAEEATIEQVKCEFDTNFFGMVRMVKAVLPVMRERRAGKIVNVSSLAGLVGVPYRGFYAASKFAVEGYSESLFHELSPFNVKVIMIEPGFFHTSLDEAAVMSADNIGDYDGNRMRLERYFADSVRCGGDPRAFGNLLAKVGRAKRCRMRYRLGTDSVWLPRMKAVLPEWVYNWGVRRKFRLKDVY